MCLLGPGLIDDVHRGKGLCWRHKAQTFYLVESGRQRPKDTEKPPDSTLLEFGFAILGRSLASLLGLSIGWALTLYLDV